MSDLLRISPPECKAAIEKVRSACKDEPKNEGLPEAGDGGGANNAANLSVKGAEAARDKYKEHKKGCEEASQPVEAVCGEAQRQANQARGAAKDEAERARHLRTFELIRDARKHAAEARDASTQCSGGFEKIYDEALERSRAIAAQTGDQTQPLSSGATDAGVAKAGKTLAKDATKEALKSFSKEAAKLVPGGSAALELADGNPAGAAKELGKELIPLKTAGKIAEKAASITIAPTPTSRCASRLTPVQAYQFGCSACIPQSASSAIEILSGD